MSVISRYWKQSVDTDSDKLVTKTLVRSENVGTVRKRWYDKKTLVQ